MTAALLCGISVTLHYTASCAPWKNRVGYQRVWYRVCSSPQSGAQRWWVPGIQFRTSLAQSHLFLTNQNIVQPVTNYHITFATSPSWLLAVKPAHSRVPWWKHWWRHHCSLQHQTAPLAQWQPATVPSFHGGSAPGFAALEVLLFPIHYPLWHSGLTNENSTVEGVHWACSKELRILRRPVWIPPSCYRWAYSTEHHMRPFGGIFQLRSIGFHLHKSFQDIFFSYKVILAQKCTQTARSQ